MFEPGRDAGESYAVPAGTAKRAYDEEWNRLAEERLKLEREKKEFRLRQEAEKKRLAEESYLFEMKWRILESELKKLAREKQVWESEKERLSHRGAAYRRASVSEEGAEVFFSGVEDELSLKKRYKELIKIYHPDNLGGDTMTLQKINKIYDILRKQYSA